MPSRYRIQLMGALRVHRSGHSPTKCQTRKTGTVLAYLSLAQERPVAREELAAHVWPNSGHEKGLTRLRQSLSSLRRILEDPEEFGSVILADRTNVQLNPLLGTTDVHEFKQLLRQAKALTDIPSKINALLSAIAIPKGELLPGLYEDWIVREREVLAEMYKDAFRQLSRCYAENEEIELAIESAVKAIQLDSIDEESHMNLIRLYGLKGDAAGAFKQYRNLEKELHRQIGEEPSLEARQLIDKIRRGQYSAPKAHDTKPKPSRPTSAISFPVTFNKFFGRERELGFIEGLLLGSQRRLVTITGMGGSGKTRLAIEVGKNLKEKAQLTIGFIPLADVEDVQNIPEAILGEFKIPLDSKSDPQDQLWKVLQGHGRILLVLDNIEQLSGNSTEFIYTLMEKVPNLSCILTSRERLNLNVEQEVPLLPLPLPDIAVTPDDLLVFPSVQLFIDRAKAVNVDFKIDKENFSDVLELLRRLEGIPLALELAASWAQTLTPAEMLKRMDEPFEFLVTRRLQAEPRHISLARVIDQSYRLLPSHLQDFMVQLSVFQEGWTCDAAQAICDEPSSFDFLEILLSRSLIYIDKSAHSVGSGAIRYRMLDLLKAYAARKLSEEERSSLRRKHAEYYAERITELCDEQNSSVHSHWMTEIKQDYANILGALQCFVEQEPRESGIRLATALSLFWDLSNRAQEGLQWLDLLLNITHDISPQLRAEALNAKGRAAWRCRDFKLAEESYQTSLNLSTSAFHKVRVLYNISGLALTLFDLPRVKTVGEEALALAKQINDESGAARALFTLAAHSMYLGDLDQAKNIYQESLELEQKLGNNERVTRNLFQLSRIAICKEQYELAIKYSEQCLEMGSESEFFEYTAYLWLAIGYSKLEKHKEAHWYLTKCFRYFIGTSYNPEKSYILVDTARIAAIYGQQSRATTLLAGSVRFRSDAQTQDYVDSLATIEKDNMINFEETYRELKRTMPESQFEEAWVKGITMSTPDLTILALEDFITTSYKAG